MNPDLEQFIGSARWFGGKGRAFTLTDVRRLGTLPAHSDGPQVAVDLAEVTYTDDGEVELYQLPLAFRAEQEDRLSHALVGAWEDPDFGPSHVYDAVHDRDAMACWLDAFATAQHERVDHDLLVFHRLPGHVIDDTAHSTLFSGEQSNSSVAFGDDSLMKIFRKVTPGVNPDVQIHDVLTEAGSVDVAALYGWLDAADPAGGEDDSEMFQLAMLQQFLRTGSDGWELAQSSVRNLFADLDVEVGQSGGDFAGESERLGATVAGVHSTLAEAFPTELLGPDEVTTLAGRMRTRLTEAVEVVPELAAHADQLAHIFDALATVSGVPVQRIHADLHLGQTLRTAKGWKIVDFEGEPAKPLPDRLLPDSPWRDVAGMLRSFDYAAAVVARAFNEADDEDTARRGRRGEEWASRNRDAFVRAYAGREVGDEEQLLLDAYEADKAVYECVYEARNRPTWLAIPLAGITRILNR